MGEGSEREKCCLLGSPLAFSHLPPCYPQANWALLVLIPGRVSLCMFQDPVGLSNELSVRLGVSPAAATPTGFLWSEVLRLYFPALEPWVAPLVCLAPQLVRPVYAQANVGPLLCQLPPQSFKPSPCCASSLPWLPVSDPPTSLDGCFFSSLVVRLPYS